MPASTEPRSGILYGWSSGESGWGAQMNTNLLLIGRTGFHLSVKDRDLATPPGTPTSGGSYIVATGGTGAWATHDGKIAVWDGAAWVFYMPRAGWIAYIEDEAVISVFTTAWSNGIALAEIANANQAAVTLGNADGEIGSLAIGAGYTQAEVVALRDKCEELADDVRALSTLVHALRTALIATGQIKGAA
jgi:hypothetical protein